MSKRTKGWLITAISLVVVGSILFVGVMMVLGWNFKKLSADNFETNRYEIGQVYRHIVVDTKSADIEFLPSETASTTVVCHEQKTAKHVVEVDGDTLTIRLQDERKWYDRVDILFDHPHITVYLPQGDYGALSVEASTGDVKLPSVFRFESVSVTVTTGDVESQASASGAVKLQTTTGDITLQNASARSLELSATTGKIVVSSVRCEEDVSVDITTGRITLSDVQCRDFSTAGSTGDTLLDGVIAQGTFSAERSTGDIELRACDAAELRITTDTGDVTGSLLSDKVFFAETHTGTVEVPKTIMGGRCEISTDTGDIRITIQ